jgi:hypothetical protein
MLFANLAYSGWHVPRSNIPLGATHERLVELIYDSAEGTSAWSDVISASASELSAYLGHFFLIAGGTTFTDTCVHGYDLSLNAPYFERFQAEVPRITLGIKNLGRSDLAKRARYRRPLPSVASWRRHQRYDRWHCRPRR